MKQRLQLAATALLLSISFCCQAQNVDIDVLKSINQHATSFKTNLTDVAANSVTPVSIAAPLAVLADGLIRKDKKAQLNAAYMAGGGILTIIIAQGTKRIIQRQRPYAAYSFIIKRSDGGGYSFPSGHTSTAFNTATALSLWYPRWYVIAPSFLWAGTVGYARMYQGVHYPSDVLTGAIVGAGSAWVSYKAQRWMEKKKQTKKATPPAP